MHGGHSVKIVERNRVKQFCLSVERGGAIRLCDTIYDVVAYEGNLRFFRKFRGSSYVFMVMINTNSRGSFLRINKLFCGKLSSIVVPSGNGRSGWRDLNRSLMSMLGRELTDVNGRSDSTKLYEKNIQLEGPKAAQKNWRLAVVVYRNSIEVTWEEIKEGFCSKLGRQVELSALLANRAILWCRDEARKRTLPHYDFCTLHNSIPVKVVNWSEKEHREDIVFEGKNSWAGIEGIPLNWWNIHVLKVIGAKLGGLLEIDKETTAFSVLNFAKIRAKGFTYGFLPSVLELPRGSDTIMLGAFPLDGILHHLQPAL